MKLSEAIRLGAMSCPQGFGSDAIRNEARCALGAALLAVGVVPATEGNAYNQVAALWPLAYGVKVPHPVTGEVRDVIDVIWELNDIEHWNRERIADWVATIEAQRDAHAEPIAEPVAV